MILEGSSFNNESNEDIFNVSKHLRKDIGVEVDMLIKNSNYHMASSVLTKPQTYGLLAKDL